MTPIISKEKLNKIIFIVLIVLCLILIVSNIVTLYIAQKEKKLFSNVIENNPYPLLDFSRNFRNQEDFVVNLKPLRTDLTNMVNQNTEFDIAVYIEFINTGANISINPDLRIFPASLTKIPVAMLIMHKVESGVLDLENYIELKEEYKDSRWGDLYKNPTGTKFKIKELIEASIRNSDNTAHNMLYGLIDRDDVAYLEEELGLEAFFDTDGKVTAREYTRIFRSLYTSSFLKKDNSQYLLMLLATTNGDSHNYLSKGLEKDTIFAHKFGEKKSEGIFLDSGIIYVPKRPYLITVLIASKTKPPQNTDEAKQRALEFMEILSRKTYQYFVKSKTN